jgi:hypothetical protein
MKYVWQVMALLAVATTFLHAEEKAGSFTWAPVQGQGKMFSRDLGMMDTEREEYATNFVNFAANRVAAAKASPASLDQARRFIALAMHLSPRNKRALVVNFQLSQGTLPEPVVVDFSPETLAKLIFMRAGLLGKQEGEENALVARMFIELAAQLDPKNEDAVYASEVQRLDHGAVDWSVLNHEQAPVGKAP